MGFGTQLLLLLWKNLTLRRRQKVRLLAELVSPLLLLFILVGVRTRPDLKIFHNECHFDGKAMPSVGIVPFLQSFFCTANNTCYDQVTPDEIPGHTANYKDSLLTKLIEDVMDVVNSNLDRKLIMDMIRDAKTLNQMAEKIISGSTKGDIKLMKLFNTPQQVVQAVKSHNVQIPDQAFVQFLNASIDFSQFNSPHLSDVLRDFDVCPRRPNGMVGSVESIRDIVCKSNSLLDSFKFYNSSTKAMVRNAICDLSGTDISHFYGAFKEYFSLKLFIYELIKYVFFNTGTLPNVLNIYEKLKVIFDDLQSLDSMSAEKIGKPIEDLADFFKSSGKPNASVLIDQLGKIVCGKNTFLQMQSSKSVDILAKFTQVGRNSVNDGPDKKTTNDYGANSPVCMELVDLMNSNQNTKILWKQMRPIVLGRIPFAPDIPPIREIIIGANRTFSYLAKMVEIAEDWEKYADGLDRFMSDSPTMQLFRAFSNSCLCEMLESKTKDLINKKLGLDNELNLESENHGVCKFLQNFLNKTGSVDGFDFKKTVQFSRIFSRIVAEYGKCFDFDKFVGYESEEELEKASMELMEKDLFWGGIVFDVNPNANTLPTHLTYKIRMSSARTDDTNRVRDQYWRPGPRRRVGTETKYLTYGFAYLQDMIDHAIIKIHTGEDDSGVMLQQFPYPCYIEDSFMETVSKTLPLLFILAWIFPVALLCKNIVHEKEKRLKEMMKIMGLGNVVHWVAWFLSAFIVMFISIIFIVIMVKYGKVMEHSDPLLLLIFFSFFGAATIIQVFMFSTLFSHANLAACSAGFLYFLAYQPYSFAKRWEEILLLPHKLAVCIFPNVAFGFGCSHIARFEEQGIGLQWHNIAESPLADDDFHMLWVLLMMIVDAIFYMIITWYIEAVFPGQYGVPQPFYFLFTRSYWRGQNSGISPENAVGLAEDGKVYGYNVEKAPEGKSLGVAIRDLKKVYSDGKKVAVDGLSMNFYEGQITSFLGHNGAGKTTTMSVLTGLYAPTEGTAYIYGKDICTHMGEIRKKLGLCPQYNALFSYLTVEEHLWFYARIKGLSNSEAKLEMKQLVHDIRMPHKAHAFPGMLSGGMKRKLSVAAAFVGRAKTVILDEPTAGVDPYARRSIWELLLKFKENRTIILSTHHMDEADVLGDRIAIISQGKLCCCGSSLFLKSRYGSGYYLTMVREGAEEIDNEEEDIEYEMVYENIRPKRRLKPMTRRHFRPDADEGFAEKTSLHEVPFLSPSPQSGKILPGFSEKRVTALVKKYVREAKLVEDNKTELTYQLPDYGRHTGDFLSLFEDLEQSHKKLGISSFGISDTNLEEVFLRVADKAGANGPPLSDEERRRHLDEISDGGRMPRPVTHMSFRRNKRKSFLKMPVPAPRYSKQQQSNIHVPLDEEVYLEPNPAPAPVEPVVIPAIIEREIGFNHKEQVKLEGKKLRLHQFVATIVKRFHHFRRSKKGFVCEIIMPSLFVLLAMVFAKIDPPLNDPPPLELHPWKLTPVKGDNHLYMFYSDDDIGSKYTSGLTNILLSRYGVGNRCLKRNVHIMEDYPCNYALKPEWIQVEQPLTHEEPLECSCSSGVQQCPAGAGDQHANMMLLNSNDYLFDMTSKNITDWIVKTTTQYMKRRYGGFSFGQKNLWARLNTDHVKEILNTISEASKQRIWRDVKDVMDHIAVHNISKVWYNNKGWPAVAAYMNVMNNLILRSKLPSGKSVAEYGITTINHPMNLTAQQANQDKKAATKTDIIIATCVIFAMSFIPASFVMILIEERVTDFKHLQLVSGIHPSVYWAATFCWDFVNYLVSCIFCIAIFLAFQMQSYVGPETLPCLIFLLIFYGWAMIPVMYPFSRVFDNPSTAMVTLKSVNIFLGTTSTIAVFILELLSEDDEALKEMNGTLKEILLILPQFCLGQGLLDLSRSRVISEAAKEYDLSSTINPLQWSLNGKNIFSMFVCGIIFFTINILIEFNFFIPKRPSQSPTETGIEEDQDVAKERLRVLSDKDSGEEIVRVINLTKVYKQPNNKEHVAVNRLCLGVPRGQCFGLLGVNGAGKTTTFKMLTGSFDITHGNAFINGFSIVTAKDAVRKSIGYCPQFDAFDGLLTAREVLTFFARIKGIPNCDLSEVVEWAIKKLGLTQYADKPAWTYSGGNRRKLSTAVALIGNPSVIFLDEPTAGMDPGARRFLWNCINNIVKDGRSVILTSHSMEECEALCNRLAIMVNGQFRCLGSSQHLKTRFGDGYTCLIRVAGENPDVESVHNFIMDTFPTTKLRERHHNMVQYQFAADIPLSQIFGEIEAVRDTFNIEDYSVSQTTLDQVFINFAMMQSDALELEEGIEEIVENGGATSNPEEMEASIYSTIKTVRKTSTVTIDGYSQVGHLANLDCEDQGASVHKVHIQKREISPPSSLDGSYHELDSLPDMSRTSSQCELTSNIKLSRNESMFI